MPKRPLCAIGTAPSLFPYSLPSSLGFFSKQLQDVWQLTKILIELVTDGRLKPEKVSVHGLMLSKVHREDHPEQIIRSLRVKSINYRLSSQGYSSYQSLRWRILAGNEKT